MPGWQRWGKLDRGCFSEPDVAMVGSDGCWPDRMDALGTRRYQVGIGSDGGSSIPDVVSKLAYMDAFAIRSRMLWKPEKFNWHAWMLSLFDRETRSAETKPGRQKGLSRNY